MTAPLRVLMVSSLWPPRVVGGAEAYAAGLAQRLSDLGHAVGVVTLGVPGEDVVATVRPVPHALDTHKGAPAARRAVFHAADVWRPDARRTVAGAARRFGADVVHTHGVAGMSVSVLTAASPAARVHTLHDYWLRCWRSTAMHDGGAACGPACAAIARVRGRALERRPLHGTIAISHSIAGGHAHIARGLGAVRVVHHPADPAPPRRVRDHDGVVFGFLGQLTANKGVRTLLDAAAAVIAGGPGDARFVVAGRGPLAPDVERARGRRIDYLGWVDGAGKEAFFASVDCLVVPSVWAEPAGLVVLEASARGVPVIASDVGGLPEYVPAACRPLLVPPGDAGALAAAMRRFAAAPHAYAVPAGEVTAWGEHTDAVVAAYHDALAASGRRATRP